LALVGDSTENEDHFDVEGNGSDFKSMSHEEPDEPFFELYTSLSIMDMMTASRE
jgi:hypothetical protein